MLRHAEKNVEKNRVWIQKRLHVYILNVSVCTGTTPACVTTCARGAGTHGDVLNVHTVSRVISVLAIHRSRRR